MMRCAIYARYSSDMQRATSIDDQVAVARKYAHQQGWTVLQEHEYSDAGISGSSLEGRPGVQALLRAAGVQPRPFDVLVVDDSSRVARDLPDAVRFLQQLRFARIRVVYISQQIDSANEQAETLIGIHGVVDGLYIREMAKKIRRGLAGQLSRGFATGGRTFGYHTVPEFDPSGRVDIDGRPVELGRRTVIDAAEAETVRRNFEMYAAGAGVTKIVEILNGEGVPGPRNQPWRYGAVTRVLRNERYRGRQVWGQRTHERRPGTRRKVTRPVPRDQWITRERPDLRIVSDALWHAVQTRLTEVANTVTRQRNSNLMCGRNAGLHSRHLFSGLMRCGVCGGSVGVVSGGNGSPRYGCIPSWRNGRAFCENRLTVRAKVADAALLEGLQTKLTQPDTLRYVSEALAERLAAVQDDQPKRRTALESRQTEARKKLDNLIRALESGVNAPTVLQAIQARESELDALSCELAGLHDAHEEKADVGTDWIRRQLDDLAGLLHEAPSLVRAHLHRFSLDFTLSPVLDEGRPFLRAGVTGDLLQAGLGKYFPVSATDALLPG